MSYLLDQKKRGKKQNRRNSLPVGKLVVGLIIGIVFVAGAAGVAYVLSSQVGNIQPDRTTDIAQITMRPGLGEANRARLTLSPPVPTSTLMSPPQGGAFTVVPSPLVVNTPQSEVRGDSQYCLGTPAEMTLLNTANTLTSDAERFLYNINVTLELISGQQQAILSLFGSGKYDGNINNIGFQADLDGELIVGAERMGFKMHIRIKNNYVYLMVSVPERNVTLDWHRISFDDLLASDVFPVTGEVGTGGMVDMLDIPDGARDQLQDMMSMFDLDGFTTITRASDDARAVHTYCFDVRLTEFLTSPSFGTGLASLMAIMGDESTAAMDFAPLIQPQLQAIPILLPNLSLVVFQDIDQNSRYNVGYRIDFSTDISAMLIGAEATVNVDVVISLNSHGQSVVIDIPSNAVTVTDLSQITAGVVP